MVGANQLRVCLDTSAYIWFEDECAAAINQLQESLTELAESDRLVVPMPVFHELDDNGSVFSAWANGLPPHVRIHKSALANVVHDRVLRLGPGLINPDQRHTVDTADPYVLAAALSGNLTVVQYEGYQHTRKREQWPGQIRIPDVADLLELDHELPEWLVEQLGLEC